MKKNWKSCISLLLALLMLVSLLSTAAFAQDASEDGSGTGENPTAADTVGDADQSDGTDQGEVSDQSQESGPAADPNLITYPLWVAGTQVTSANCGYSEDRAWWFDPSLNALHLRGDLAVTADLLHENAVIYYEKNDDVLRIVTDNDVDAARNIAVSANMAEKVTGIYSAGSLEIYGKLNISTGDAIYQTCGISAAKQITVMKDAELAVTAGNTTGDATADLTMELAKMQCYGIFCETTEGVLQIADGSVSAIAAGPTGIAVAAPVLMSGEAEFAAYGGSRGVLIAPTYSEYTALETAGASPNTAAAISEGQAITDFQYVSVVPGEESAENSESSDDTADNTGAQDNSADTASQNNGADTVSDAASQNNYTESTNDSVTQDTVTENAVTSVSYIELGDAFAMYAGTEQTITPVITPADAADRTLDWYSDNESIAVVDTAGKVTAVAAGTATITAQLRSNPDYVYDTVAVTVVPTPTYAIELGDAFELAAGTAKAIDVIFAPYDAVDRTLTWSSSDESVAVVDAAGNVTAISAGTATITAQLTSNPSYVYDSVTVTVPAAEEEETQESLAMVPMLTLASQDEATASAVAPTAIELGDAFSLTAGAQKIISVGYTPDTATDKTLTWSSSDETVAKVDASGNVTAVAAGTATITAQLTSNPSYVYDSVTVNVIALTSAIELGSDFSLSVSDTKTIGVTYTPENAADKDLEWSSSDETVAYVDTTGKVIALGSGTAVITAKLKSNNTVQDTVTVTVTSLAPTAIELGGNFSLSVGSEKTINAGFTPETATDREPVWASTNTAIATVDENGTVKGVADGTAVITAKLKSNNSVQDYVRVTVSSVQVTGISLNKTSITLAEGEQTTLTYSVTPSDASDARASVTSGNAAIASISTTAPSSKTITVTGVKAGTTTITFTSGDGGYTVSCPVTVTSKNYVTGVAIVDSTGTVINNVTLTSKGTAKTVYAVVSPTTATVTDVEWTASDNNTIVYLTNKTSNSCVINAYGNGTTTITAMAKDGSAKYATINVVVSDASSTYKFTYKDNSGVWYYDSSASSTFTVKCDGPYSLLQGVLIDGYVIPSNYYTAMDGGGYTTVTFPYSFMSTLAHSRHTLSFVYTNATVSTYVWSRSLYDPPITGDTNMTAIAVAMSLSALAAASSTVLLRKKKED